MVRVLFVCAGNFRRSPIAPDTPARSGTGEIPVQRARRVRPEVGGLPGYASTMDGAKNMPVSGPRGGGVRPFPDFAPDPPEREDPSFDVAEEALIPDGHRG